MDGSAVHSRSIYQSTVTLRLAVIVSSFSIQFSSMFHTFGTHVLPMFVRRHMASGVAEQSHASCGIRAPIDDSLSTRPCPCPCLWPSPWAWLWICQRHADLRLALPLPSLPSPYADRRESRRGTLCHRQRRRRSLRRLFLDALLWLTQFLVPSQ